MYLEALILLNHVSGLCRQTFRSYKYGVLKCSDIKKTLCFPASGFGWIHSLVCALWTCVVASPCSSLYKLFSLRVAVFPMFLNAESFNITNI